MGDRNYQAEGTGLGLSITKKLIKMMGGELHVESILGHGSTFWMVLDLLKVSGLEQAKTSKKASIIGFKHHTFSQSQEGKDILSQSQEETFTSDILQEKNCKILVVDDNRANRAVMKKLLLPLGFEVFEAVNGQEGVDKALVILPDVILMDLMMPVMSGFEATRKLRQSQELKDVVIIAISASVFEQDRQDCLLAGCNIFIAKPVQIDELLEKLQEYLELEWVYENEGTDCVDVKEDLLEQSLVAPPIERLQELYKLAMIGDVEGITELATELEEQDSQFAAFTAELQRLSNGFEVGKIQELISRYLDLE